MASNRRGRETRQRILDAAAEVFSKQGFAVTVEEIAEAAHTSRVTVYRHFSSRDELLVRLLLRDAAEIGGRLEAILGGDDDPAERLTRAIVTVVRHVVDEPWLHTLVTASNPSARWLEIDPDDAFLTMSRDFFRPHLERIDTQQPLRVPLEETLDWLLRQVLLMLTVPGMHGQTEEGLRTEIELWLIPAIFAGDAPGSP